MINPVVLDRLAELLEGKLKTDHVGQDNAVTAAELVEYLRRFSSDVHTDRDLRDVVHHSRHERLKPVISTYSKGYSWPTGPDDDAAVHCVSQMLAAGSDMIATAAAIEDGMEREFEEKPIEPEQLSLMEVM